MRRGTWMLLLLLSLLGAGCELIVDFDRSKIVDAGPDAGMDGGMDAGMDGGVDGGADGGPDSGTP